MLEGLIYSFDVYEDEQMRHIQRPEVEDWKQVENEWHYARFEMVSETEEFGMEHG